MVFSVRGRFVVLVSREAYFLVRVGNDRFSQIHSLSTDCRMTESDEELVRRLMVSKIDGSGVVGGGVDRVVEGIGSIV